MYIFARTRDLAPGHFQDGVAAAVDGGARAAQIIGLDIFVWTPVFSQAGASVMWSCRADSLDQLMSADDALFASQDFGKFITEHDHVFSGSIRDTVSEVVYGAPTGPPGRYIQLVQAVRANGSMSEGTTMAVELAEMADRLSGLSAMVAMPVTGAFGAITWITSVPDLTALTTANAAVAADPEWMKLLDRAGHCYQPNVTTSILRRLN